MRTYLVTKAAVKLSSIDGYAKDDRPGEVWLLYSFYLDPLALNFVSGKL